MPILISAWGARAQGRGLYHAIALEGQAKRTRFALLELPDHLDRFLVLPEKEGRNGIMFLDDVVRVGLPRLFATFEPTVSACTIEVTRDAEIDMDDDLSKSLLEKMKGIARGKGRLCPLPVRPDHAGGFAAFLIKSWAWSMKRASSPAAGTTTADLMGFPDLGSPGWCTADEAPATSAFEGKTRYSRKSPAGHPAPLSLPRLFPTGGPPPGGRDRPEVTAIRIDLYRVAKNSHVINALTAPSAARRSRW